MFRRVIIEDWHQYLPMIGFALTFAVFLVMLLRALLMRRDRCQTLAHLPLDEPLNPALATAEPAQLLCDGKCADCRCLRDSHSHSPSTNSPSHE